MKIAVIIIHYGLIETTRHCLTSLKSKIGDHQLILINNSESDIKDLAKIIEGTILIDNRENDGFAKAVNQGITLALKDKTISAVFLMNNDLTLTRGSFSQLVLVLNKIPSAGIVTPILHHKGGYDWGAKLNKWTGMVRHKNWDNKPKTIQPAQHVAGAAMLIRRKLIDKIGLFDEKFFVYYEDVDYCLRAYDNLSTIHITPDVEAEHIGSAGSTSLARTRYQWVSHFRFVNKYLFKHVYPTAYIYSLIMYPLFMLKNIILGSKS
jgi:GT2 family glycosyltransferase